MLLTAAWKSASSRLSSLLCFLACSDHADLSQVTVPLLTYDVLINIAFTAVFISQLGPFLRHGVLSNASSWKEKFKETILFLLKTFRPTAPTDSFRTGGASHVIEKLLWKSLAGTILILLPTVGNLVSLLKLRGHEQGWLCFTLCTLDGKHVFNESLFEAQELIEAFQ